MPEYLIWTTADPGGWPAIPRSLLPDVLAPHGCDFVRIDGPGDLRLALGGCEMIFSGEPAGWQVRFEGDTSGHDTGTLVSQVARQIHEFTGETIKWILCD